MTFICLTQQRSQGIRLDWPIITKKAVQINQKLNGDPNFKASQGWLRRLKERHGIRHLQIEGAKLSANSEIVSQYQEKLCSH